MSDLTHTPGPWIVREVTHSNVPGKHAFAIDFNEDQEQVVDWVYEKADALLIAAAPDLLSALVKTREELRACQSVIHCAGGFSPAYVEQAQVAMKIADAAIAKTKGDL